MSEPSRDDPIPVGECLRQLRLARGWSQEALADRAGVHRTFVGLVERGSRHPRVDSVHRVLVALGCTWEEFGRALDAVILATAKPPRVSPPDSSATPRPD